MKLDELPYLPHYIIQTTEFSRRFVPPSGGKHWIRRFYLEQKAYKIIYRHKTPLSWLPLNGREVKEQINTINPEILILKKRKTYFTR